ncbi:MAG: ATP-binding protein [Kiritimatiellales bacterium]|nr:ATP-binding protein [Kiritimatiellota bacterium]MBL7012351.1 ATP-binding protein [Kiritimatiellales bacterium]
MEIVREFTAILEKRLKEDLNFIQVVLGPRQVGKTTGLRQIAEKWSGPVQTVTADAAAPPSADWIELNWKIARSKGPGTLLIVDEVQKIPNWSQVVKRLFDEERALRHLKVVLLGSASLSLQKGLADSLAGRYEVLHAGHWNLAECRRAFGWDLMRFLKFGGYPAAAELTGDVDRWRDFINHSIIEPVLSKDLLSFAVVNKPALFRQTFLLSLAYPAMEVSLQKILGQLQESGNVSTIKHYLELFEGAYLIKTLQKYSGSEIRKRGSSPKIVPLNTALVNAQGTPEGLEHNPEQLGRIFECAIGAELHRQADELYYWRDGKEEVDFVAICGDQVFAIEVKSGRIRRTGGLIKFTQRYPKAIPVVIDLEKGTRLLEGMALENILRA